jgi:hypothetical protein
MRNFSRLATAVVLTAGMSTIFLGTSASPSFGSVSNVKPTLTATQAAFVIPTGSKGTWILKLWTLPTPTHLVGKTTGTSGTLTLPVPQTASCEFQVDVRVIPAGRTVSVFYSGLIATVPGCGPHGTGARLTPGFWKNHAAATQALLPQSLGSYQVTTATEATAVFRDMKCRDAGDCLAGHLLAAELDVANGSSTCISGVVTQANQFLDAVHYQGPGSYPMSSAQRNTGIGLANALDSYTNDSSSSSC